MNQTDQYYLIIVHNIEKLFFDKNSSTYTFLKLPFNLQCKESIERFKSGRPL